MLNPHHANFKQSYSTVDTSHSILDHSILDQVLMGEAKTGGAAFRADVYSFGVVVWEFYTGKLPWEGMPPSQIIVLVVERRMRLDIPPTLPPSITALLAACWQHAPTLRPTMEKIKGDFPDSTGSLKTQIHGQREHPLAAAVNNNDPPPPYTSSAQLVVSAATAESTSASRRSFRGCAIARIAKG